MANPLNGVDTIWWMDWQSEDFANRSYLSLSFMVEILEVFIEKPGEIWVSIDSLTLTFETNETKVVHHLIKGARSTVPMALSKWRDKHNGYILRPPDEHPCLLPTHHICLSSLPNGTLTCSFQLSIVSCSIDFVNKAIIPQNIKCTPLSSKLGAMLTFTEEESQGKHSDVTLIAGASSTASENGGADNSVQRPAKFYAHKAILAAHSPVFARMFEHDMKEGATNEVTISDIEPDVLKEMLSFMYTNQAIHINEVAYPLLYAADKYQIEELMTHCEHALSYSLSVENCIELLLRAQAHRAPNLKETAMQFIVQHGEEVMQLEDWDRLKEHAELLSELIQTIFTSEPRAKKRRLA